MDREEFIGTTRVLPNESILTVTGYTDKFNDKGWWVGKFICHCTSCSLDEDYWPEGSITISKGHWKEGRVPCSCSTHHKPSARQRLQLLTEHCKKHGLSLVKLPEKLSKKSKIAVIRGSDGKEIKTTYFNLLHSSTGDYNEDYRKEKLPDSVHIEDFIATGKYPVGSEFTSTDDTNTCWKVRCPKCSSDEYVKRGLCSGVFHSTTSNLKRGVRPCRCSKFSRTENQWVFEITKLLKEEGHYRDFSYKLFNKKDTKFSWKCKYGHIQDSSFTRFFYQGNRCAACLGEGFCRGFYIKRSKEYDTLYITYLEGSEPSTFKIGRSFDYSKRERGLSHVSKSKMKLHRLFEGTHEEVFKEEQRLHTRFNKEGKNAYVGWTEECFFLTSKQVKELIVNLEEI